MRKLVGVMVVCLTLGGLAPRAVAGGPPYIVKPGDSLWQLSGSYLSDPAKYDQIVKLNPFLREQGRQFVKHDGTFVVIIKPGEHLQGLENLEIVSTPLPIEDLLGELTPPTPAPAPIEQLDTGAQEEMALSPHQMVMLIGGIIGLLLLVLIAAVLGLRQLLGRRHERELRQDPVTSGPPIVAGGIEPTETARLTEHFDRRAAMEFRTIHPGAHTTTARPERIGPIEAGMISGEGMVGYADHARPRRIDPPQPGFRARFRFPNGREELLVSLQPCMNPVFFGEGMSGFTFTPERDVVPTPQPQPPVPQPVPHPAMAARAIRAAAESDGQTTLTVGDRVMVFERGVHLNVDPQTGAVNISGGSFEMTVKPRKRPRTASEPTPRQTTSSKG